MIYRDKNERINLLVREHLVPNRELLALDPIIAGGSILFCYLLEKSCQENFHWNLLLKRLKISNGRNLAKGASSGDYSDIDFWFTEDNDVHSNPDSKYKELVADYTEQLAYYKKGLSSKYSLSQKLAGVKKHPNNTFNVFGEIASAKAGHLAIGQTSKIGRSLDLQGVLSSTNWANTFSPRNISPPRMKDVNHQFIKKPVESVEALISDFDFTNCMVAWKDDYLYYDSELMDLFNSGTLKLNADEQYVSGSLPSKVFNALRALKYGRRYGLDFDETLMQHIFKVYVDCKSLDYDAYDKKVAYIKWTYGQERATSHTFKSMVARLKGQFETVSEMKTFKQEYALYLIDDEKNLPGLKAYIDKLGINKDGKEEQGVERVVEAFSF
jgi:hypothetical protein